MGYNDRIPTRMLSSFDLSHLQTRMDLRCESRTWMMRTLLSILESQSDEKVALQMAAALHVPIFVRELEKIRSIRLESVKSRSLIVQCFSNDRLALDAEADATFSVLLLLSDFDLVESSGGRECAYSVDGCNRSRRMGDVCIFHAMKTDEAVYQWCESRLATIEIVRGRSIEKCIFPVPSHCREL